MIPFRRAAMSRASMYLPITLPSRSEWLLMALLQRTISAARALSVLSPSWKLSNFRVLHQSDFATFCTFWISRVILFSLSFPSNMMSVTWEGQYLAIRCPPMSWMADGAHSFVAMLMSRRLLYALIPTFTTSLSP